MPRETTIPAQIVREDIRSVEEYPNEFIRVMVGIVDAGGAFIVPQEFSIYEITNENFAELMSADPEWAPGKPAGTFRNDDLWIFIDRLRNVQEVV